MVGDGPVGVDSTQTRDQALLRGPPRDVVAEVSLGGASTYQDADQLVRALAGVESWTVEQQPDDGAITIRREDDDGG